MTSSNEDPAGEEVDVHEAASRAQAGRAVVLDVREDDEWVAGHVPGATHIPLGQLAARSSELDPDRPVLAICRSGNRSRTAAAQLSAAGFDVSNVVGGMQAWVRAGLPAVAEDGARGTDR